MIVKIKSIEKKDLLLLFSVLIISILSSPPFIMKQLYIGEDMLYHFLRIEEFANNIAHGNIFPHIYENALGGYGYGSAFFYPEVMLIIPAIFYMLGLDVDVAVNTSIIIYNISTILIAYYSLSVFLKDIFLSREDIDISWLSLLGALAYGVFPYRLYTLFYRGALNEFIAISFIPLALLSMYKIFIKKQMNYWKLLSLSFTLLLLSHLSTTLILGIVGFILLLINIHLIFDLKFIKSILSAIFCSLLFTAYFLFPMIEQMLSNEFFYSSLPKLDDITIYPIQTIDKQAFSVVGEGFNQLTVVLLNIFIIFSLTMIIKKYKEKVKAEKGLYVLASAFIFVYLFLMLTNLFPWEMVVDIFPVVQQIQFPFRFFVLGGVPFSLIILFSIPKIEKQSYTLKLMFVLILNLIPFLAISGERLEDLSIKSEELPYVDKSWCLVFGEYLPSKIDTLYEDYIKERGNVIIAKKENGDIERVNYIKDGAYYLLPRKISNVKSLELPLVYYKGYQIYINDEKFKINQSDNGFIEVLNVGDVNQIEVKYKGTLIQKISTIVTIFSLIVVLSKGIKILRGYKNVRVV